MVAAASRSVLVRGAASALIAPLLTSLTSVPPAHADVKEEIRKAASVVPGYGPADLLFPPAFRGRWRLTREVVSVDFPLGRDKAPSAEASAAERQALGPATYDQRFVETTEGDGVIPDRAFNAEQREAALLNIPLDDLEARWSSSNPNIVTMRNRRTNSQMETKVTKRSLETPGEGAFGTSEYARVADAGSEGVLGGVPRILATRERVRYRWNTAAASPIRVEGLEIFSVYDPTQTGFADLAGATPVLTVKARLVLEKVTAASGR